MTLKKIARIVSLVTIISTVSIVKVNARENDDTKFDWDPLMDAITQVESEGKTDARNGNCVGAMQIAPILVQDCNDILKQRGENRRFTLKDRFNVEKSREMFILIQSKYNPANNIERAIRIWNGGVHYKNKSTQRYYVKVMKELAKK